VGKDEILGFIADPFGENEMEVRAPMPGIVIGRVNLPLVNEGEALFHVARFEDPKVADETLALFRTSMTSAGSTLPSE
jgi:predicted deacylase